MQTPSLATPLLASAVHHAPLPHSSLDAGVAQDQDDRSHTQDSASGLDLQLARRLASVCSVLRPVHPALLLVVLSVLESVVVAQAGKLAGSFYHIIVDHQPWLLAHAMLRAAGLYAACIACSTAGVWLSSWLALRWRQSLTLQLHQRYTAGGAFSRLPKHVDNPDQRITADAAALCDALGSLARLAAGAPFRVAFYTYLARQYIGWAGVGAVYAFFGVAAMLQRLVAVPLARRLFRQEQKEGDLRFSHLRLREYSPEVAAYRGGAAEKVHLDASLLAALTKQLGLVNWRAGVAAATRTTDYAGALLNYGLVAGALFSRADSGSGGEDAQFVSNASFMTLALVYSFTELLDLAEALASAAALASRVGQLLDFLPAGGEEDAFLGTARVNFSSSSAAGASWAGDGPPLQARGWDELGQELQPSEFAALLQPPTQLRFFQGAATVEISVHALGPDLHREVRAIFPDAPPSGQLLACLTFQFAGGGSVDLAPDRSSASLSAAAEEMDRLLGVLLAWEGAVRARLAEAGPFWADVVDPRSGMALQGARGSRWSEVAAAHSLLRYEKRDTGVCPVVVHPVHGTSAYPATFFTNAPFGVLWAVVRGLSDTPLPSHTPSLQLGSPVAAALLQVQCATVQAPGSDRPIVRHLDVALGPGQHLLITGPNGVGKSTLLRTLCGLHPLLAGTVSISGRAPCEAAAAAEVGACMFIPQRPLAAPGLALWQQLVYPSFSRPAEASLSALLHAVGLSHLLHRTGGSFDAPFQWDTALSPGELQRLSVARVLHRRPALVLLDEVTAAVSAEAAAQLYALMQAQGVTCVSVGQDVDVLRAAHTVHLRLGGAGGAGAWGWEDLHDAASMA